MNQLLQKLDKKSRKVLGINLLIMGLVFIYLLLRFKYLNDVIPFWYTKPWGDTQLAAKEYIFFIPFISFLITTLAGLIIIYSKKFYLRYGNEIILTITTIGTILFSYSIVRIMNIASTPFDPIISPKFSYMLPPMFLAFGIVYFVAPRMVELLKSRGIITDPTLHEHPGMILKSPSARSGGLVFTIGFLAATIFFVKINNYVLAMFGTIILTTVISLLDDIQNTRKDSKFRFIENPVLRFGLQGVAILPIIFAGIRINAISNPFGDILHLNDFLVNVGPYQIAPIAVGITILWMLWIMNTLSWSNGVDGQYAGIVGIAALVIAIITARLVPHDPAQKDMVYLAAIAAGAAFGLIPYTWNPSKIMWGFGAISAASIIGTLAILTEAKIAIATLVLIVPFLDGLITIIRRMIQGKSPFKGDGGHLHHLLMERGLSVKQVALFYWGATLITGVAGIIAADRALILTILTLSGIVAFFIVLLNFKVFMKKNSG